MYTICAMPKKTDVKGEFIHFQFKLYGDERDKWTLIKWCALGRALERHVKVDESAIRRALFGMKDADSWLVTNEERKYFRGYGEMPESLKGVLISMEGSLKREMGGIRSATDGESRKAHPPANDNQKKGGE